MDFSKYIKDFKSDALYYGDMNFITNSQLGRLAQSPAKLEYIRKYGQDDTTALLFGRAFHLNILEPNKFKDNVLCFDGTRRGKAWDEFKDENTDKTIITKGELGTLKNMRKKLLSIPKVNSLLMDGEAEVVNCWEDEGTGVYCKGKVDYVKMENDRKIIIDIKSTQNHTPTSFIKSCMKYGYDRQSAFYMDGFEADEFWFVAIEKTQPYDMGIYMCGSEFVQQGREKYKELLKTYDEYFIKQSKEINGYYIETIL